MDILIADDSVTSRRLLKRILNKMNFNTIEAIDGEDAWSKFNIPESPRIAIVDWMMPKLDGIGLIKKIRERDQQSQLYTYLIMITSNSEEKDIHKGFIAGADDYITKPIDPQALSIRLKIGRRIIKQQSHLYNVQKQLERQLEAQKEQILKAQDIQQILNTSKLPTFETVNLRAVYNPSQDIGGDFFNIIKTASNKTAVVMVDCTGHGLEASMYATLLKSVCDRHISLLDNPQYLSSFVQMVNTDVADYISSDQFPVMFASVYDPVSQKFYYSSANGEHPYLIRNHKVYKLEKALGMHLGYNTEGQYDKKSFKVKHNDIVFFYSDAIIEIENASWNRSNDIPLKEQLSKMGKGLYADNKDIMQFIYDAAGSTFLEDDLSMIYFQIKMPLEMMTTITTEEEFKKVKSNLAANLIDYDYNNNEREEILLTFNELILNALHHGNKGNRDKKVYITYKLTCEQINLSVEDEGCGFDENQIPDPTDEKRLLELLDKDDEEGYSHGRGVWMVKKFMDKVTFTKGGRLATVTKKKAQVSTYNNYSIEN